jgi:hypothetical protein
MRLTAALLIHNAIQHQHNMSILHRHEGKDYYTAHQYSSLHRKQILASSVCGCFYCLEIFSPSEIEDWVDESQNEVGQTALCPKCGIDSVIGDKSGVKIEVDLLKRMRQYWF